MDSIGRKELQYFLEGIASDVARFRHVIGEGLRPEDVRIRHEVPLGTAGWADIQVEVPGERPYFVEVKVRHSAEDLLEYLPRKYANDSEEIRRAGRLVVLVQDRVGASGIEGALREQLPSNLALEIWTERTILEQLEHLFGIEVHSFVEQDLVEVQAAIDRAKGLHAFGARFANDPLQSSLLWHFSFWKLKKVLETRGTQRSILPPGLYRDVVTVFADLSSFSSYVRDTRDDGIVRDALTSFYSKARHQVLNNGGMMYQFLGDGVVALFGLPEADEAYVSEAFSCARAMLSIGSSVSHDWQRQIDQVQRAGGAHVGIAVGDLNIIPLRPFSRAHIGAIADSINTAARISGFAEADEIVTTNAFYQRMSRAEQQHFTPMTPVDARNIGKIQVWRGRF